MHSFQSVTTPHCLRNARADAQKWPMHGSHEPRTVRAQPREVISSRDSVRAVVDRPVARFGHREPKCPFWPSDHDSSRDEEAGRGLRARA